MEQLTLEQAAAQYGGSNYIYPTSFHAETSFKAGAEWQKEQYKPVQELLKGIAEWAGNLSDEKMTTPTGAKDAALRGGLVTDMRSIAVEAIRIFEPDYTPFEGYKHTL